MQTPQAKGSRAIESSELPIATYLGRQIFLKRVVVDNLDRGAWLHWSHPQDQRNPAGLKYGQFVAPQQSLESALMAVYQTIEASIELELVNTTQDHDLSLPCRTGVSSISAQPCLHLAS